MVQSSKPDPSEMKGEESSEVPTGQVCTCTARRCLGLLATFGLLAGMGLGIWFLVKPLLRPLLHFQASGPLQDSEAAPTRCENIPVDAEQGPPNPFGNASRRKVFFRISRSNFLLEAQLEGHSDWLLLCHENWGSSLGTHICRQLGHVRLTHHKAVNLTDVKVNIDQKYLKVSLNWKENAQEKWQIWRNCPSGRIVALKCSDCGATHSKMPERRGEKEVPQRSWQVGLYLKGKRVCAGALLSPEWIISAAHCMDSPLHLSNWVALVGPGAPARIQEEAGLAMEKVALHPSYNHVSHDYDLVMLKLKEPLTFSDTIQAVCLPLCRPDVPSDSSTCQISGTVPSAEVWEEVPVALNSPPNCNSSCGYKRKVTSRMLCAHRLDGTINVFQSESGSALVCEHEHTQHIMGVRSWDTGCPQPGWPSVYTKVGALLDWIHNVMETSG